MEKGLYRVQIPRPVSLFPGFLAYVIRQGHQNDAEAEIDYGIHVQQHIVSSQEKVIWNHPERLQSKEVFMLYDRVSGPLLSRVLLSPVS
jgi:hypothetical protein